MINSLLTVLSLETMTVEKLTLKTKKGRKRGNPYGNRIHWTKSEDDALLKAVNNYLKNNDTVNFRAVANSIFLEEARSNVENVMKTV